MSNPTYKLGAITAPVNAELLQRNRLVKLTENGLEYAADSGAVFGAITENGAKATERESGDLRVGYPDHVAVHTAPAVVPLEIDDASSIKAGDAVYAAADGKVASSGSTVVGVAIENGQDGATLVEVRLITPVNG